LKNFSYLTAGTIIAQIIAFIGFIYIARYLGPELYGIYVTVGAFAGMFHLLTFTGLRKVILRACSKNEERAGEILNKTIGLQSFFIFLAIIAMLISSLFTGYETRTILFIAIFSLNIFSVNLQGYFSQIYLYSEKMEYLGLFDILKKGLFVGLAILFLSLGYGLFSIVILSVATSMFTLLLFMYNSRRFVQFNLFSDLHIDKKIIKPSIVFSGIDIVGRLHSRVDLVMISFLGSPIEVAIYGVAYNLARESEIIKNKLASAFFPIAVKTLNEKSLRKKTIIKYSFFLTVGMFCLAILGYFLAEPAVTLLFGAEYSESGSILKILIFYVVAWFSILPFTEAIQATGNEKILLVAKGIMAGINIPLNILLYLQFGLIGIAYSTLIVYTVGSVLINVYSYHILGKQGYLR